MSFTIEKLEKNMAKITIEVAVEEFDKNFPPKVKAWQPSQEEFYIHSHSVINW